jgi:hypothetical protein
VAQVTGYPGGGIRLGKSVVILTGIGNPNNSSTPDVMGAGLSSLYHQLDAAGLWLCTTGAVTASNSQAGAAAVWTQITVP